MSRVLFLLALAGCASPFGHAKREGPPNVLLVSLDTFRADRVGTLGNTDGLTPNLDRFAAEGITFTHAYSQASVTLPSHTSILTSRYPSEVAGSSRAANIAPDMYTLPQVLGAYGYQTAARVAGGDLSPRIGPTKGFDTYEGSVDFGSLYHTVPMGLDWLDARDAAKPFFLFVHTYDTHAPYMKPTPFGLARTADPGVSEAQRGILAATARVMDGRLHTSFDLLDAVTRTRLRPRAPEGRAELAAIVAGIQPPLAPVGPADEDLIRDVYDGAVAYTDAWFGVFMARLQERDLLDDTVIVVLADHGDVLGEGGLFHRCCTLGDEVSHVPLLVRLPGGEGGGKRVDAVVELVDVLPTVLTLVGAEPPAGIRGTSLAPALRGEPFAGHPFAMTQGGLGFRMLSARSAAGRLTYTGIQATDPLLADMLATAQLDGPAFEATEGIPAADLETQRTAMVTWFRSLRQPKSDSAVETPPELKEQLKARGYWDAK
jgi:arylsulfatase A-like enzyme